MEKQRVCAILRFSCQRKGLTWLLPEKFTASDIGPKAVTAFLGIFTTINEHIIQNVPTTRVILDHPGLIHPFLIPYSSPGGFYEQQWYTKLLEIFGPGVVDVVTHHIYILGSGNDLQLVKKILGNRCGRG